MVDISYNSLIYELAAEYYGKLQEWYPVASQETVYLIVVDLPSLLLELPYGRVPEHEAGLLRCKILSFL